MKKKNVTKPQLAFVFAVLSFLMALALINSSIHPAIGALSFYMMFSMISFILGLISLIEKQNNKIERTLAVLSIAIPVVVFICIFFY